MHVARDVMHTLEETLSAGHELERRSWGRGLLAFLVVGIFALPISMALLEADTLKLGLERERLAREFPRLPCYHRD